VHIVILVSVGFKVDFAPKLCEVALKNIPLTGSNPVKNSPQKLLILHDFHRLLEWISRQNPAKRLGEIHGVLRPQCVAQGTPVASLKFYLVMFSLLTWVDFWYWHRWFVLESFPDKFRLNAVDKQCMKPTLKTLYFSLFMCSSFLILFNFIQFGTGCDPWPKIPIWHFGTQPILVWHLPKFGIQDEIFRNFCLFCTSKGDLAHCHAFLHSAVGTVTRDRDQNSSRHRGCVTRDRRIEWNSTVYYLLRGSTENLK
jgi:hypothetical protein